MDRGYSITQIDPPHTVACNVIALWQNNKRFPIVNFFWSLVMMDGDLKSTSVRSSEMKERLFSKRKKHRGEGVSGALLSISVTDLG